MSGNVEKWGFIIIFVTVGIAAVGLLALLIYVTVSLITGHPLDQTTTTVCVRGCQ